MHQAVILAAGRGERLRPRTDYLPKPLLSVAGRPLIVHHLDNLAAAGVERVFINLSHLGPLLPRFLGRQWQGMALEYSDEGAQRLETGGALIALRERLGNLPFLLLNGDICTEHPLPTLLAEEPGLVLVANPAHHPQGDFAMQDRRVALSTLGTPTYTYTGLAFLHGAWLENFPPGPAPLLPWLRQWIAERRLRAYQQQGYWCDVGTPERLQAARLHYGGIDGL
ncbi:nucleotidyltransferase family protein [Acidithiobacillus sp. IBUN Pt1247-S3]|uniref:nucleotidyltransferase family protein n=1 Tax=Acidithiobacillus sp. IBUN Pt1247-S3 TaxID=3166642 RepID=UPI0034E38BA0